MPRVGLIALAAILSLTAAYAARAEASPPDGADLDALDDLEALDDLDALDQLDALDALDEAVGSDSGVRLHRHRLSLASETRIYVADRDAPSRDEQVLFEASYELDVRMRRYGKLFFRPRFLIDARDTSLYRLEPLEAYLAYEGKRTRLRVGQLVANWGVAEVNTPLDVLNRPDLGVNFLDPPSLGELGVALTHTFAGGSVVGQPAISVHVLPLFRKTPFPTRGSRFRPTDPVVDLDLDTSASVTPEGADHVLAAARFEHTLTTAPLNADLSYVVARGPDHIPHFDIRPTLTAAGIVPVYHGAWTAGMGIRAVPNGTGWSRLTLKVEAAHRRPYSVDDGQTPVPREYTQITAGFDVLANPLFGKKDQLLITLEFAGEVGEDDPAATLRPFDHDAAPRLFWEAQNFGRTTLEVAAVVDVTHGELVGRVALGQGLGFIHEGLRLELSGDILRAATKRRGLLAQFHNESRVTARFGFDI